MLCKYHNTLTPLLPALLIPAILTALGNQLWIFQVIQTILPKNFGYLPPKLVGGDGKPIMHFDANTSVDDFTGSTETSAEEEVDITILSHEVNTCLLTTAPRTAIASSSKVVLAKEMCCIKWEV